MNQEFIRPGRSYLSIHGVPYRVLEMDQVNVVALCERGRASRFEMSIARFAKAMDAPKLKRTGAQSGQGNNRHSQDDVGGTELRPTALGETAQRGGE